MVRTFEGFGGTFEGLEMQKKRTYFNFNEELRTS